MRVLGFTVLVILLVNACAGRSVPQEAAEPFYFDGLAPAFPGFAERAQTEPAPMIEDPNAVVLSAIIDRGDESIERAFISGRFICHPESYEAFELPCRNVSVAVQDDAGREVQRIVTNDGDFVFPAEKEKRYYMRVLSKHRPETADPLALRFGEDAVLHLIE